MGDTKKIVYDLRPELGEPHPGELLDVHRLDGTLTGTRYLIVGVREVRQRQVRSFRRWALSCERLTREMLPAIGRPDPRIWPIRWYRRGEVPE